MSSLSNFSIFEETVSISERVRSIEGLWFVGTVLGNVALQDNQTICTVILSDNATMTAKVARSLGTGLVDLTGRKVLIFRSSIGYFITSLLE